jgi:hypothetical protein
MKMPIKVTHIDEKLYGRGDEAITGRRGCLGQESVPESQEVGEGKCLSEGGQEPGHGVEAWADVDLL